MDSNNKINRASQIKECENQSRFVSQRVNEIENFFGNLCSEFVHYTRRNAKLRNNGDEIARIILDYSIKETVNRTTSIALKRFAESLTILEDYHHTEVDRIVNKIINPLASYGDEIKNIRQNLRIENAARKKELANIRKLDKSTTEEQTKEAEIQLHNAMIDATKSANNLERCVLEFEARRLKGIKTILLDFVQIEMIWHAKALEIFSSAYNSLQSLHEESDLVEFRSTLLRSSSQLFASNSNPNPPRKSGAVHSFRRNSHLNSSIRGIKGENISQAQSLSGNLNRSNLRHNETYQNDDITSLFTDADEDEEEEKIQNVFVKQDRSLNKLAKDKINVANHEFSKKKHCEFAAEVASIAAESVTNNDVADNGDVRNHEAEDEEGNSYIYGNAAGDL